MPHLTINGQPQRVDVDPDTPLLWALRDTLALTGTRYGRGIARCGACTVPGPDARKPAHDDRGTKGAPVQRAWIAHDVPQCGYCQSGMIMAVAALLKEKPQPSDADIDAAITNICRCGTYARDPRGDPCRRLGVTRRDSDDIHAAVEPPLVCRQRGRIGRRAGARVPSADWRRAGPSRHRGCRRGQRLGRHSAR